MRDLYFRSQNNTLIWPGAWPKDVAELLVNGSVSYEEALDWCGQNDISEERLRQWLRILYRKPKRKGPPECLPVSNCPPEKKHYLYQMVVFLNQLIDEVADLIREEFS